MDATHASSQCVRAWHALRLAHNIVERQLVASLQQGCGLSPAEVETLIHIRGENDGMRLSEIRECVALSQPAISRMIERLETRGLIERQIESGDRRAVRLSLTAVGDETARRGMAIYAQTVHDALEQLLSDNEMESLLGILDKSLEESGSTCASGHGSDAAIRSIGWRNVVMSQPPFDPQRIRPGTPVIASNGEHLGVVREAYAHYLLVDQEAEHDDLNIPVQAILEIDGTSVRVSINRDSASPVDHEETAHHMLFDDRPEAE